MSREGLASAAVQNPADPDEWFIYAFGGINTTVGAGAPLGYLDTYEWMSVVVDPLTGDQTVGGWTESPNLISAAKNPPYSKAYLHAWVVTAVDTDVIPEDDDGTGTMVPRAYVFVGGGYVDGSTDTNEVVSGYLDVDSIGGELLGVVGGKLAGEKTFNQSRGGAVGIGANGYLYILGGAGAGGGLINQDSATQVGAGAVLDNWTAEGPGALKIRRAFAGFAEESAFFFVAGGSTDPTVSPQVVTTAVEQNTK